MCIHLSEQAVMALHAEGQAQHRVLPYGERTIKGKGAMRTYIACCGDWRAVAANAKLDAAAAALDARAAAEAAAWCIGDGVGSTADDDTDGGGGVAYRAPEQRRQRANSFCLMPTSRAARRGLRLSQVFSAASAGDDGLLSGGIRMMHHRASTSSSLGSLPAEVDDGEEADHETIQTIDVAGAPQHEHR